MKPSVLCALLAFCALLALAPLAAAGEPPNLAAALALALVAPAAQAAGTAPPLDSTPVWMLDAPTCEPGLRAQPGGGPFGVLVFCENALGAYLAVVRLEPLSESRMGGWDVGGLVWRDEPWSSDVTSYAWAPDGQRLFVATKDRPGTGGLYELDLPARTARQLAPAGRTVTAAKPGPGYVIDGIDYARNLLHYRPIPWNSATAGEAGTDTLYLAPRGAPVK